MLASPPLAVPNLKPKVTNKNPQASSSSSSPENDDHEIINEVLKTHHPDGSKVDAKLLLGIIQNILPFSNRCVNLFMGTEKREALLKDMVNLSNSHVMLSDHSNVIDKLCCEISCQCASKGGPSAITIDLFKGALSKFTWDGKLVLMVSAFAVNYGEFGLFNLLYTKNEFATNIGILKRVPNIIKDSEILKTLFITITKLVDVILEATNLVVQFNDLPSGHLELDEAPLSTATSEIRKLVYWTVLSIVNCSLRIGELSGLKNEFTIKKISWELSGFVNRIRTKVDMLKILYKQCKAEIEFRIAYINIVNTFEMKSHEDNLEILKVLFHLKDDQLPLVIGNAKSKDRHPNNTLKDKEVLLLITGLDLDNSEKIIIDALIEGYKDPKTKLGSHYHVIWIPIVDKPDEQKFKQLQGLIPWYTVISFDVIKAEAKKYIRDVWQFTNKTFIMHFNAHGIAESDNLIELIHIWGSSIFPLTKENFDAVIRKKPLDVEAIIDDIYPIDKTVSIRIIYGGEDIYWIKKLKFLVEKFVSITGQSIELIYVSKGKDIDDELKTNFHEMKQNVKSSLWGEYKTINHFWSRLESIFKLRIRSGSVDEVETDDKIIDIITMLNYRTSYEGWAVFTETGSSKMTKATGKVVLQILTKITEEWKEHQQKGFIETINTFITTHVTPAKHCNHIALPPSIAHTVGDKLKCVICRRPMEPYQLMYRCCVD